MLVIVWIIYAILDGIRDALHFHQAKGKNNIFFGFDIHVNFTINRLYVLILIILLSLSLNMGWLQLVSGCILVFPFFHDGAYYWFRNKLKPGTYPKGWTDHSKQTTAQISFNYYVRQTLAIIGLIIALWQ